MSLRRHKAEWEEIAAADPLWAIASDAQHQYGRWNLDEFFATGEREISEVLAQAATLGLPTRYERALDFGCGVGRLTRAIAARFDEVVGVDISTEMLSRARHLNADVPNCTFILNVAADLRRFESRSFDFVYTSLVLQHLPNRRMVRHYLAEFLRVLRPGGVLVFQLPHLIPLRNRLQLRRRLYSTLRRLGFSGRALYRRTGLNPIRMISMREEEIRSLVSARGGIVARAVRLDEPGQPIKSTVYYVHLARHLDNGTPIH